MGLDRVRPGYWVVEREMAVRSYGDSIGANSIQNVAKQAGSKRRSCGASLIDVFKRIGREMVNDMGAQSCIRRNRSETPNQRRYKS